MRSGSGSFFNRALKSSSYVLVPVSILTVVAVTLLSTVEYVLQDAARISQIMWMSLAHGRAVMRSGHLRIHPDFVHTSRKGEDVPRRGTAWLSDLDQPSDPHWIFCKLGAAKNVRVWPKVASCTAPIE